MDIRPARFTDLPTLLELERADVLRTQPKLYPANASFPWAAHLREREAEFRDPWVTFTLAEDDEGACGFIEYTEDQLRNLVIAERMRDTSLREELYGEAVRHWKAAAIPSVRLWALAGDQQSRAYYEAAGWRATRRTRRSGLVPHPLLAEYLLVLGPV